MSTLLAEALEKKANRSWIDPRSGVAVKAGGMVGVWTVHRGVTEQIAPDGTALRTVRVGAHVLVHPCGGVYFLSRLLGGELNLTNVANDPGLRLLGEDYEGAVAR